MEREIKKYTIHSTTEKEEVTIQNDYEDDEALYRA